MAQLRALGVVSGDLDLADVLDQSVDASTLAFYGLRGPAHPGRGGTELTVGLQVTLVHELTHALQDQYFDLDELLFGDDVDSSASAAARALAEGDATRIEERLHREELDHEEQAAYDEEYPGRDRPEPGSRSRRCRRSSRPRSPTPYALGPAVRHDALRDRAATSAVDDAFDDPPTTEEHLFDPASFLADEGADEARPRP